MKDPQTLAVAFFAIASAAIGVNLLQNDMLVPAYEEFGSVRPWIAFLAWLRTFFAVVALAMYFSMLEGVIRVIGLNENITMADVMQASLLKFRWQMIALVAAFVCGAIGGIIAGAPLGLPPG